MTDVLSQAYSPEQCLEWVKKSPAAVAKHDKKAWTNLFARYSIVEDPVGCRPHISGVYDAVTGQRGMAPLERFYENFIAPNNISFAVEKDIVCGLQVVRDLTISIEMSASLTVQVPMHLLYELTPQDGELKIMRLAAHWELWPMLKQQLASGTSGISVCSVAGWRMLKYFGLSGTLGFFRAFRTVGNAGSRELEYFVQRFNSVDRASLNQFFSADNTQVNFADGNSVSFAQLVANGAALSLGKIIVAGNIVSASCAVSYQQQRFSGVVFVECNMRSKKPHRLAFYLSEAASTS